MQPVYCVHVYKLQDTRPLEEYQVSHLPGALQVDPQEESSLETLGISPNSTSELHFYPF